ncbi:hypothetical protein GC209_02635 [bacterium]|nr:hypothetical protein [bacterium]
MRLVCPNCDAEYEVDNSAIPLTGRDVQCSNCGHAWYQTHPDAASEPASAVPPAPVEEVQAAPDSMAPEPAIAEQDDVAEVLADPTPPVVAAASVTTEAVEPAAPPGNRNISQSVLAVLREEAEREASARRAEAPPALETQTEMPLEPAADQPRSRPEPKPAPAVVENLSVEETKAPAAETVRSRGDRLPAIDEINSTLRATSDRSGDLDDDAIASLVPRVPSEGGFRRGFLMVVLIGVILLALYVFAPLIAAKVPALKGAADGYVAGVNAARVWLDARLRSLIGILRGFTGGTDG